MPSQFTITYEPQPEDLAMAEHWKKYSKEYYLEEAIEGNLGIFYEGKPILETIIFNYLPKDQWIITNTPKLRAYRIAQWLIEISWRLFYDSEPEHTCLAELDDWETTNSLSSLGDGTYWPNLTIWKNNDGINLHVQPLYTREDGYNFMGYNRQPHTILTIEENEFINQRHMLVTKVLKQCTDRNYPKNELQNLYNELL